MAPSRLGARLLCALCLLPLSCTDEPAHEPAAPTNQVVVDRQASVPDHPDAGAWKSAPTFVAPLILQDMVEPRLTVPSTAEVRVQAISDGDEVAFRLEWADATQDDLPRPARFSDACAVQLPANVERDLPAPQMGEDGRPVEITYWRASWQADVDGRKDEIKEIYPGATVDHYPFEAASLKEGSPEQERMARRFAPARAAGNEMAGPRQQPVQALVGEGPGTLRPAESNGVHGRGTRTENGWSVVLVRRLPAGLKPGTRSEIAFAVWEGSSDEVGSRKMRSIWIPLSMEGA